MITKKEIYMKEYERDENRIKKMGRKKLTKRIVKAFKKLNNKKCYKFLENSTSKSYHNLLDFLSLLEKKCEKVYGDKSKYSKSKVEKILREIFSIPTKKECKTLSKINKCIKHTSNEKIGSFKFKSLFKGKRFETALNII